MSIFTQRMRHGYANILNFNGREGKGQFWTFAGMHLLALMFVYTLAFMFLLRDTFAKMQKFAVDNPEKATVRSGPGGYSIQIEGHHPELMPDMEAITGMIIFLSLILTVAIGAAVTRRLHDSGWRGFVALVPLALLWLAGVQMMELFSTEGEPEIDAFLTGFGFNLAYILSLVGLIFLLVRKGDPNENQFGLPPAD